MDEKYADDEIDFAAEVLKEFLTVMFYEGYSHRAVINFMDNVESYDDIVEKINSSNIVEGVVSEEYVEEELAYLAERGWVKGALQGLGNLIKKIRPKAKPKQLELPLRTKGGMRPANTPIRNAVDDAAAALKNNKGKVAALGLGALGTATIVGTIANNNKKDENKTGDDNKPTGDDNKPTGNDNKPTGNDNKPTEGGDKKLTPMQQWAKANQTLAAAAREKERIRGTSETDNPLMKGMISKMPKPKVAQDTENEKYGKGLPKVSELGKGHQSLTNNPNVKKTKKEAYDYVLDYLFETGQAETVAEANGIMLGMDDKSVYEIIKERVQE
jgi:hypothetical protein